MNRPVHASRSFLIGIAGGSGSGKSQVARTITEWFAPQALLLAQDGYYRDRPDLTPQQRHRLNYDEPAALDHVRLREHLHGLLRGEEVERLRYDFVEHRRMQEPERVHPAPMIVVEGLFAWWDAPIRDLLDLRIFVEAEPDLRLLRRLRRDVGERGRTVESVLQQYTETVRPMHIRWIEPARHQAHVVLSNSGAWEETEGALRQILVSRLPAKLSLRLAVPDTISRSGS